MTSLRSPPWAPCLLCPVALSPGSTAGDVSSRSAPTVSSSQNLHRVLVQPPTKCDPVGPLGSSVRVPCVSGRGPVVPAYQWCRRACVSSSLGPQPSAPPVPLVLVCRPPPGLGVCEPSPCGATPVWACAFAVSPVRPPYLFCPMSGFLIKYGSVLAALPRRSCPYASSCVPSPMFRHAPGPRHRL